MQFSVAPEGGDKAPQNKNSKLKRNLVKTARWYMVQNPVDDPE